VLPARAGADPSSRQTVQLAVRQRAVGVSTAGRSGCARAWRKNGGAAVRWAPGRECGWPRPGAGVDPRAAGPDVARSTPLRRRAGRAALRSGKHHLREPFGEQPLDNIPVVGQVAVFLTHLMVQPDLWRLTDAVDPDGPAPQRPRERGAASRPNVLVKTTGISAPMATP